MKQYFNGLENLIKKSNVRWDIVKRVAYPIAGGVILAGLVGECILQLNSFTERDQLRHAKLIAERVGYENPERVIGSNPVYSHRDFVCGDGIEIILEGGTKLHYEIVCNYKLRETQLNE